MGLFLNTKEYLGHKNEHIAVRIPVIEIEELSETYVCMCIEKLPHFATA